MRKHPALASASELHNAVLACAAVDGGSQGHRVIAVLGGDERRSTTEHGIDERTAFLHVASLLREGKLRVVPHDGLGVQAGGKRHALELVGDEHAMIAMELPALKREQPA